MGAERMCWVVRLVILLVLTVCIPEARSKCSDSSCPRTKTCCDLDEGGSACCPYKDAICCIDGVHCCPFGTVCDTDRSRCIPVDGENEMKKEAAFVELVATTVNVSNEHCPDGSTCPGVSTCCMTPTKHYGCCPFQSGVCCRDLIHCCPYGTHCSGTGLCYRARSENDVEGAEAEESQQALITLTGCRGGQRRCAGEHTCCDKSDGSAGCCPLKNAVCCSELDACCPEGYMCSPKGCVKL